MQVGFLEEDTLVLSLKGGELYVLTLLADSMRYVRSFHFEKAAASVLTTCVRKISFLSLPKSCFIACGDSSSNNKLDFSFFFLILKISEVFLKKERKH